MAEAPITDVAHPSAELILEGSFPLGIATNSGAELRALLFLLSAVSSDQRHLLARGARVGCVGPEEKQHGC
eukprot:5057684-Alexandrium_andersonii.AAC.1